MTAWTQLEAYAVIREHLSACQWKVWQYLHKIGGNATRNEIDAALAVGMPNANYSRRLSEMERRGAIRRGEPRACRVTGRQSTTWWPVYDELREMPRKQTKAAVYARALQSLAREIQAGTPEQDPAGFVARWRSALTEIEIINDNGKESAA